MLRFFVGLFIAALTIAPAVAGDVSYNVATGVNTVPEKLDVQYPQIVRITLRYVGGGLHDPMSGHKGTCNGVTVRAQSLVHARKVGRNQVWELTQAYTVTVDSPAVHAASCAIQFTAGKSVKPVPVTIKAK